MTLLCIHDKIDTFKALKAPVGFFSFFWTFTLVQILEKIKFSHLLHGAACRILLL